MQKVQIHKTTNKPRSGKYIFTSEERKGDLRLAKFIKSDLGHSVG